MAISKKKAVKKVTAKKRTTKKVSKKKTVPTPKVIEEEIVLETNEMSKVSETPVKKKRCRCSSFVKGVLIFVIGLLIGSGVILFSLYSEKGISLIDKITRGNISLFSEDSIKVEIEVDKSFSRNIEDIDKPKDFSDVDLETFWDVWDTLENDFVAKPKIDTEDNVSNKNEELGRDEFLDGAIKGLSAATGDIYTDFLPAEEAKRFTEEVLDGEIDGVIGAYISIAEGGLTIIKTFKDSPADYAGLEGGDLILEINGEDTRQFTLTEASSRIRGKKGTSVFLKIYRPSDDDEFELTLIRDSVDIPEVETEIVDGVFVIKLLSFTKQTARSFNNALKEFRKSVGEGGENKILLDMRGNTGGILSVVPTLSRFFLEEDSVVFYEYLGDENLKVFKTKSFLRWTDNLPEVTILVDGATASASEILAEALKYHNIADIVGTTTVGKGSVQTLKYVGDKDAILKITTAHWLTPGKKSVVEKGVELDVDYEEDIRDLIKENEDFDIDEYMQNRAIKHLLAK